MKFNPMPEMTVTSISVVTAFILPVEIEKIYDCCSLHILAGYIGKLTRKCMSIFPKLDAQHEYFFDRPLQLLHFNFQKQLLHSLELHCKCNSSSSKATQTSKNKTNQCELSKMIKA